MRFFRFVIGLAINIVLLIFGNIALAGKPVKTSTPPSSPGNFSGNAISQTEIKLTWDKSISSKRIRSYYLYRGNQLIKTTKSLSYTDSNLSAGTNYTYYIEASDGNLASEKSTATASTVDEVIIDPPEPPASSYGPESLNLNLNWTIQFDENFDGNGNLDTVSSSKNFRFETLVGSLHRAGNSGMDELGNTDVPSWQSPSGKRWSAWYNGYNNENTYRENGSLVLKGKLTTENDPTRPLIYEDSGVSVNYGAGKIYTTWVDTWARTWSNELNKHIVDTDSPNKIFKYGYFETKVNFSEMNTPGFRLSIWLMPASTDAEGQNLVASNAYNADGNDGVEIDIFEYEYNESFFTNKIIMSVHGGTAGGSNSVVNASDIGVNLQSGDHVIGFLWLSDQMSWYIDGNKVKEVTDINLIPDVYSYLIVSRELNSGVKDQNIDGFNPGDVQAIPPYLPRDPGLYGENAWLYRNRLLNDKAKVDYIKVWKPE